MATRSNNKPEERRATFGRDQSCQDIEMLNQDSFSFGYVVKPIYTQNDDKEVCMNLQKHTC